MGGSADRRHRGGAGAGGVRPSAAAPAPPDRRPGHDGARGPRWCRAAEKTSALRSAFTMSFRPGPRPRPPRPRHRARSELEDFSAPAGTMTLDLPGGPSVPGADGVPARDGVRQAAVVEPPLQPGRPWIFANFADIAKYNVKFPPYIVQTESVNPALVLDELAWGTTTAASDGPTPLDGVPTRHYRARVEPRTRPWPTPPARRRRSSPRPSPRRSRPRAGTPSRRRCRSPSTCGSDGSGRLVGARVTPPGAGIGTVTSSSPVRIGRACVETAPGQGRGHRRHDPRWRTGGAQRW